MSARELHATWPASLMAKGQRAYTFFLLVLPLHTILEKKLGDWETETTLLITT